MERKGEQKWRVGWGPQLEELFLNLVICLSHMIWQVYWLNSSYWPILNLHGIFVRLSSPLDIQYVD